MNTASQANIPGTNATVTASPVKKPRNHFQRCIFCGDMVNLDEEGTQYANGSAAHEGCEDGDIFNRENAADLRD